MPATGGPTHRPASWTQGGSPAGCARISEAAERGPLRASSYVDEGVRLFKGGNEVGRENDAS